jgi:hypothetical protein
MHFRFVAMRPKADKYERGTLRRWGEEISTPPQVSASAFRQ